MSSNAKERITTFRQLDVYNVAFKRAMAVFEISKSFPRDERYALVDQSRRSSRSVCANIAEAWYKRFYPAAFRSKLTDSSSEAAETQVWIDFARSCGYLRDDDAEKLKSEYDKILGKLVVMMNSPENWKV
jgi:four helix bundle protein